MKNIKIILLGFFIISLAACDKYPEYCKGGIKYEFDMPVSVSPGTDTIHLGDTLWVELRIPHLTVNKVDGKTYDIAKVDLFMYFAIQDLLLPTVIPTGAYITLNEDGTPASGVGDGFGPKVRFKVDGDSAYWKLGFVITKKGLYMLSFSDLIDRSHEPHITECPNEKVQFHYNFNTTWESNYYLLQYSHDENARSWGEDGFNKSGNYVFCVD